MGIVPLLLETLVDTQRFRGTCYRAANWLPVGQTAGCGRMDREHQRHGQVINDIYVHPLVRDARERLCGDPGSKSVEIYSKEPVFGPLGVRNRVNAAR
jgi:hypothetical protein